MKITVTEKLIKKAKRLCKTTAYNSKSCPLALAFKEKTKKDCSVGPNNVIIDGLHFIFSNRRAKDFIADFDSNKKVEPHTFIFKEIPNEIA